MLFWRRTTQTAEHAMRTQPAGRLLRKRPGTAFLSACCVLAAAAGAAAQSNDCNNNGIPDHIEIAAGMVTDIDFDGVPDECQVDCNNNGIPDEFEMWFEGARGLIGIYYENIDFTGNAIARLDLDINYYWGLDGPFPDWQGTNYSVRWVGWIRSQARGNYSLSVRGVEGLRLYLGGEMIVDAWDSPPFIARSSLVQLEANTYYPIMLEHFQRNGFAAAVLEWIPPGQVTRAVIPFDNLYPVLDMNGDGIPDDCVNTCPGDMNGDGVRDVEDYMLYLDAFFAKDPAADIDGDGQVNVNDFFLFLNELLPPGPCN